jgi:hypothetical protein
VAVSRYARSSSGNEEKGEGSVGHRANFVVLRDGSAVAFHDPWAALGSTWAFAAGPDEALSATAASEPTTELLDWAFAEAGYLLDFDRHEAIVFGYPEMVDFEFDSEEMGEFPADDVSSMKSTEEALPEHRSALGGLETALGRPGGGCVRGLSLGAWNHLHLGPACEPSCGPRLCLDPGVGDELP